jgi:hypothetical protein
MQKGMNPAPTIPEFVRLAFFTRAWDTGHPIHEELRINTLWCAYARIVGKLIGRYWRGCRPQRWPSQAPARIK